MASVVRTGSDEAAHDLPAGLLRQRRGLMVVSLVLVFFHWGQVQIKQVSALGASVEIGRPEAVEHGLWLVWGYFLLRYYQYFRREPRSARLRDWFDYRNKSVTRYALRYCQPELDALDQKKYERSRTEATLLKESALRWQVAAKVPLSIPTGASKPIWEKRVGPLTVSWIRLQAAVAFAARATHFTDYWLPFVLAAVAFVIAVGAHLRAGHGA